ncbi:MAG: hypothetical protein IKR69_05585 [Bacteroidales bacterium]|nr:hypothetical protein [Bacteroidales bacterium]
MLSALMLSAIAASGQTTGTYSGYSPYSVYGIGDMAKPGNARNNALGGIGIASRDHRFINTINPAAVTARDTLSFMADLGMTGRTSVFAQNGAKSAKTVLNISEFVISFPIWRSSALMVGIAPYSNMGYNFTKSEQSLDKIGHMGSTETINVYGNGSVYEVFVAGGATFWKRLSIGAEFIYYFGNLGKHSDATFGSTSISSHATGYNLQVRSMTGKFGLQFEQPISKRLIIGAGATYRLKTNLDGNMIKYANKTIASNTSEFSRDTLGRNTGLRLASEWGVGLSLRSPDKFLVEVDYVQSDWRKCGLDAADGFSNVGVSAFSSWVARSVRAGFEYTPAANDIRYYFKRCTYRVGAYFEESYYRVDGHPVTNIGVTFGATLPVFRGYNGITVGFEVGQRGRTAYNLVRERYFGFNVSFNIFDIWFQKPRYE